MFEYTSTAVEYSNEHFMYYRLFDDRVTMTRNGLKRISTQENGSQSYVF